MKNNLSKYRNDDVFSYVILIILYIDYNANIIFYRYIYEMSIL